MKSRPYPSIKKHQSIQTKVIGYAIVKTGTTEIETTVAPFDGGAIYRIYPNKEEAQTAVSHSPSKRQMLVISVVTGV